jgi:NAD(P)-dependent dehydrogenase (short-subunit alcohol dehydrogenase family)
MTDTRIALISGANKGIGFESARRLAGAGVHVLLGARDPARGQAAQEQLAAQRLEVDVVALDVTDPASIAACAAQVERVHGRLDILVNNAGAGFGVCKPSELPIGQLRDAFETNFFSAFTMIRGFLPLLRRAPAGRIVNVSSGTASLGLKSSPEWVGFPLHLSGYAMSKTALNALTVQFAAELHGSTVRINAVEPGYTQTDLTGHQGFQTAEQAAAVIEKYALAGPDCPNGGFFDINGPYTW